MKGSLQEKSGKYYVVFRINGKQKWVNTGIECKRGNKRKAELKMSEILMKYTENPNLLDKVLFIDYIYQWIESIKNKIDIITYEGYNQYLIKHIIPYFQPKNFTLQDVKMSDIENYYMYKAVSGRLDGKKGGLSYRTIKLHSVVLNLIFEYAMRNKLIKENPCTYAKIPQQATKGNKRIEFYDFTQCQNLLNNIKGTPLYNMVYITFLYGLRRSELLGLKWSAIDFDNDKISINHTVVLQNTIARKDKTKNETSKRIYPLLPEIKLLLERMRDIQNCNKELLKDSYISNDYIFVKSDGSCYYPSYPTHQLQKALKKYNMPHIRWHDLRHSCASMLFEKGWTMKDISEWLGHSDIGTTMNIYAHINMEHKRQIGNSLSGILAN